MAVHDLKKRASGEAALGLEGLHHILERRVAQAFAFQHGRAGAGEKIGEGRAGGHWGGDGEGVHQQAHQLLRLRPVAVGDGDPDADGAFAGEAEQQAGK